jgi:hypothetical protein
MLKRLAAALLLTASCAASAAETPTTSFRSGGVEFQVPTPAGYCLPRGGAVDLAQLIAAADEHNVTHLTLFPCAQTEGTVTDYIILKTPKVALLATVERGEFLAEMGATFGSPEFGELLSSGKLLEESGKAAGEMIGVQLDLSGSLRALGSDDRCAYLGGTIKISSAQAEHVIAAGACMTVVAGRILTINWYGPDRGSNGVAELLRKSKRLASEITGKPAS